MDDNKIIELFFARSEEAISALDSKYGKICYKISYNILNDNLDTEECVNDAYMGTWNAIPPNRPNPLLAFVCKIVRNISLMRYRTNNAIKRNSTYDIAMSEIEHSLVSPETLDDVLDAKFLARRIESFLDTLTSENRVIFMRRYWFSDSYADISKLTGLTEKSISVRLTRIRHSLRTYLEKEGVLV